MRTALIILGLVACSGPATPPEPSVPTRTLRIAAINDFHGALYERPARKDPSRARGGLPWLHAALNHLRESHDGPTIVVDGGDLFQGSWPVNATQGMGAVEAFELLGVDATVVGNHEFDYGGREGLHPLRGNLERAAREADFHWLSANITEADGSPLAIEGIAPWTIIERDGLKIGVFGLTTEETPQTTLLRNVADLTFGDVVAAAERAISELRREGAQVVIMLGHLTGSCPKPGGYTPDTDCESPGEEIGRLLTELPPGSIDVMVTGHAHTVFANRWADTFVLQSRSYGRAIGQLDLVIGPDGVDPDASTLKPAWQLVHDTSEPGCEGGEYARAPQEVQGITLTPTDEAIALVKKLESEAGSLCDVVGCTTGAFGRDPDEDSPLGSLVTDAMRAIGTDIDVAITNSGGLRADLPEGPVRREAIHGVMPFDNRIQVYEMTGAKLRLLLRIGSSDAHGIGQISGGTYGVDPKRTTGSDLDGDGTIATWEHDRLCDVTIGDAPLDDAKTYRVAVNDFMAGGGDHLGPAFVDARLVQEGPLLRDAIADYIGAMPTCRDPSQLAATKRIHIGACGEDPQDRQK